ncbi:ABC-type glycerol-3-phosphate transport system permease component [Rhizobium sp. BK529]|uniref:hypothetical protein n=1 Tax=unclassified Rhizobium TaxID=2613769 RepID=UPI0010ECEB03|nr:MULTISPECIES: hypothetical protein [unclassified Rhizobium]MBB3593678.1 ABC-type glycerol-3-phosphate transport system permease component [Rhizobium sp. BK529]TCS03466.1 hypothetical protein EV281_104549 [Rhizobium sp. BK418]
MKQSDYHTTAAPQFQADDPLATVRDLVEEGAVDGIILTHTTPADWGAVMAASMVMTLPIALLFLFFQSLFVGGLTAGATKG